ncbi:MAG TPA: sigma-70 family RNA polymerase sigma factor [Candidatus Polarisedimenticolaceae bacterium]|nr:sigma-70 family RNA polymerase sigma factor [Candidatus Polarisedimenticolaceae bacterium]
MEDRAAQEQRLAAAALAGDADAFGQLVERYQRLVASIAWRYGLRREELEDAVSEVFLKAYRNLHLYRPEHPFSTWLYRLATNQVLDHARKLRREGTRSELPEQLPGSAEPAPDGLERQERTTLVRRALREVPLRYREALFLVYVEGLKVDEAARVLAAPVGTVKTRLMRGREALRRILRAAHPGYFDAPGEPSS